MASWFETSPDELLAVVASSIGILSATILVIRIVGLRSLSKMSSFDFGITVALGSIIATVAATSTSLVNGSVAIACLLGVQFVLSRLRVSAGMSRVVDNEALLVMADGRILDDNLRRARITEDDLYAKLREANVIAPSEVLAVVVETTGDVSVVHGDGPLDPVLLTGVRDGHRHSSMLPPTRSA